MTVKNISSTASTQGLAENSALDTNIVTQAFFFLLVTFFGCSNTILTTLSKNKDNTYDYETISVPLCTEVAKFALSFALLVSDNRSHQPTLFAAATHAVNGIRSGMSWQYIIVAILYSVQNNLLFFTLQYLDPGTLHILGNLRIPIVAVLLFYILKKPYSRQQIVGITMLTIGAILYTNSRYSNDNEGNAATGSNIFGYALALLMTLSASIAGVLNEYCFKKSLKHQSVDLQNFQLYFFGSLLNLLALLVKQPMMSQMFRGYNVVTICIIVNGACFGVSVGYITRYCDNNVRSFAGIASMLLAAVYSHVFLTIPLPTRYLASLSLVSTGILMYAEISKILCSV